MPFDIYAKHFFLTYSQVPTSWDLNCFSRFLLLENTWLREKEHDYAIGEETHADGGKHFHVLLCFRSRTRLRNERLLDVSDDGRHVQHPNIQAARDARATYAYVTKGGLFQTNITRPDDLPGRSGRPAPRATHEDWQAVRRTASADEFDQAVQDLDFRFYLSNFNAIRAYREHRWGSGRGPAYPSFFPNDTFNNVPDLLQEWVRNELSPERLAVSELKTPKPGLTPPLHLYSLTPGIRIRPVVLGVSSFGRREPSWGNRNGRYPYSARNRPSTSG